MSRTLSASLTCGDDEIAGFWSLKATCGSDMCSTNLKRLVRLSKGDIYLFIIALEGCYYTAAALIMMVSHG